jgi:hypothetical protein
MQNRKSIESVIYDLEKSLAIHNYVKQHIPNVLVQYVKRNNFHGFISKHVNSYYTNFDFLDRYQKVYVSPYLELNFDYNGQEEKVRVYSSPRLSRLVYMKYSYAKKKQIICFSRLAINFKNNNFKMDMLNACRLKILDFIQKYPSAELDQTHLDSRLKKLIALT